ncbi:RebB family R body protein [Breoghania sp. L-A4]|uniref:RebB family R body protein n=1 Tax=Breoghania sp. L-A4 TaxID=2304600 RepID=UPI000E35A2B1|nr:RebB family R body protein [Breoghania sp. L-A4]AXS41810.1 RebB like protein [Breoghania sp. L-A4]
MPDSTTVNPQVTDAVTQTNTGVLGEAPAMAMGNLYQTLAHSTGILMENAVAAQQQAAVLAQAAANQGVIQIYTLNAATMKVAQSDVPDNMLSLLSALRATTEPKPK